MTSSDPDVLTNPAFPTMETFPIVPDGAASGSAAQRLCGAGQASFRTTNQCCLYGEALMRLVVEIQALPGAPQGQAMKRTGS